MSHLSIGEVLGLLLEEFPDVTISKIRFLESQGLIDPERTPSGYRKFYDDDVELLRCILREQRENYLPLRVIKDRIDSGEIDPTGEQTRPRGIRNVGDHTPHHAAQQPSLLDNGDVGNRCRRAVHAHRRRATRCRRPRRRHRSIRRRPRRLLRRAIGITTMLPAGADAAARRAPRGARTVLDERDHAARSSPTSCHTECWPPTRRASRRCTTRMRSRSPATPNASSMPVSTPDTFAGWRVAAEREAGLLDQLVQPLLRQRNPEARAQAMQQLVELEAVGGRLRSAMMREALRSHTH